MIIRTSPRFLLYVGVSLVGLVLSVVVGRIEPALIAAPFVMTLAAAAATYRPLDVTAEFGTSTDRAIEGDVIDVMVRARSTNGVPLLTLDVALSPDVEAVGGHTKMVVSVPPGGSTSVRIPVRLKHWGVTDPARLRVTARDRFGFFEFRTSTRDHLPIRVHPREQEVRALLTPDRFRRVAGAHIAPERGEGCEMADVRQMRAGDRLRDVNWRITARRGGEMWITERHPERSADVILLLDRYVVAGPMGDSTLHRSVRAAMTLSDEHLAVADRIGLLDLGANLRWIRPRLGRGQLHRIIDALLASESAARSLAPDGELNPVKLLPPGCIVVAISPLLDRRSVDLLLRLRSLGYRVRVIEIPPEGKVRPARSESELLARRMWRLTREARAVELRAAGVPVRRWEDDQPLDAAVAGLRELRPRVPGAAS